MNDIIERLREWGCDMDGAMERFLNDTELYEDCLKAVVDDEAFDGLKKALDEHNADEAFGCAHTLKGVLSNMGLTPMFDIIVLLVEPLRVGDCENLMPAYERLMESREKLRTMME